MAMNYFERLIRRALLEAPTRVGESLRDPFETEAPWPLDTPAQHPAAPWPTYQRAAPVEASAATSSECEVPPRPVVEHEVHLASVAVPPGKSISPAQGMPRIVPAASTGMPPPAVPTPLMQADGFMHSIGVALQDAKVPAIERMAVEVQAPVAPTTTHQETPRDSKRQIVETLPPKPQTLQPPHLPPTPVSRQRTSKKSVSRTAALSTPPKVPEQSPSRPATTVVRETIRVVGLTESQGNQVAQLGAAPPTFGAGQL